MSITVSQLKTQLVAAAQEAKQLIRGFPTWHSSILTTHGRNIAVSRIPASLISREMEYLVGNPTSKEHISIDAKIRAV